MKVKFTEDYKEWAEEVSKKEVVPVPFDLEGTHDAIYTETESNGGILIRFDDGGMVIVTHEDYEIVEK